MFFFWTTSLLNSSISAPVHLLALPTIPLRSISTCFWILSSSTELPRIFKAYSNYIFPLCRELRSSRQSSILKSHSITLSFIFANYPLNYFCSYSSSDIFRCCRRRRERVLFNSFSRFLLVVASSFKKCEDAVCWVVREWSNLTLLLWLF